MNIGTFGRQSHNNIGTFGRQSHNNIGTFGRQSHKNIGTFGRQSHNNIYWCPVYLYINNYYPLETDPSALRAPPLTSGRKEKCSPQPLHSNVLITFLPKVRGGVAKRRRGLFFFSRHNSGMAQWKSFNSTQQTRLPDTPKQHWYHSAGNRIITLVPLGVNLTRTLVPLGGNLTITFIDVRYTYT